jgi:hypothetical protein
VLNLLYDEPRSNFAFKFNLRRCIQVIAKVERSNALKNIDGIIAAADGRAAQIPLALSQNAMEVKTRGCKQILPAIAPATSSESN